MPSGGPRRARATDRARRPGGFGVQIVAPRSIIACAKSPGRVGRRQPVDQARGSPASPRQRRRDREEPRDHALDIAVDRPRHAGRRRSRRWPRRCRRRCREARAARPRCPGRRRRDPRRPPLAQAMQVAGARIIAEPGPGREDVLAIGARQAPRPSASVPRTPGNRASTAFDRRLLQHDLREPDAIGIGHLARKGPPGQTAGMAVVPVEQAMRGGERVQRDLDPPIVLNEQPPVRAHRQPLDLGIAPNIKRSTRTCGRPAPSGSPVLT